MRNEVDFCLLFWASTRYGTITVPHEEWERRHQAEVSKHAAENQTQQAMKIKTVNQMRLLAVIPFLYINHNHQWQDTSAFMQE
jgi:hypothetical protein